MNEAASTETLPARHIWPLDIMMMAVLTAKFWAITIIWYLFDLSEKFSSISSDALASESNLWIGAMSGLLFFYFIIAWIILAWTKILVVPTCLLATLWAFRRLRALSRWLIAVGVTIAAVTALNNSSLLKATSAKTEARSDLQEFPSIPKDATLQDIDPRLPPTPVAQLSEEDITAAMIAVAEAKCVPPIDPDLADACTRQKELQDW